MQIIGTRLEIFDGKINKFITTITEKNEIYDIDLYQEFDDKSRTENTMLGIYAFTIASAKRRINLDTGFTSKDWKWEIK